jgi:tetratricopeptide (TPR) repeat protein
MRIYLSTTVCLLALSIMLGGNASLAAQDNISAAPFVPPADREKAKRPPRLLPVTPEDLQADLKTLKTDLLVKPDDAQLHYKLGEVYRKLGQNGPAADEYMKAINLDQTLWAAYHQLTATSNDARQLDSAFEKLSKLESQKPKELLLRVALSEMFEKRGNYYQAARTLIDCTYNGGVPEKWRTRVNARIHNMLVLSKSQKQQPEEQDAVPASAINPEEEMDLMPAPLPVPTSKRSLAQAKIKDAKEVRGMGNTPLLP